MKFQYSEYVVCKLILKYIQYNTCALTSCCQVKHVKYMC